MNLSLLIQKVYAAESSLFSKIENPLTAYGDFNNKTGGIIGLLSNLLRVVFVVAGLYALFNLIIAGFVYMTAAGDAKQLASAWARIWQTFLGLVIIVGSFAIAAVLGYLFFQDPTYILNPKIYGPGTN